MMQGVGATRRVVCRMNRDKCRAHRPMQGTSAIPRRNDALRDFQFACAGASESAEGGVSGSYRTGRKEKPHQNNRNKSERAKFHRSHFRICEMKAIKGLQGAHRAELFGIE